MIELKGISKHYANLNVLSDINLVINRGEVVSIVGPSGAGKTTLLQIIGTLLRPDAGSVSFDGVDVTRLSDKKLAHFRNKNIGFVFQFHQLLPEFTIQENVALPAMIAGESHRAAMQRASELLTGLNLADRLTHRPDELSGGEKQRAAVARALVNSPEVILADEPSGSLDSVNRRQLYDLFFELRESTGTTFVIVTHDETLSSDSDRIIYLTDGKIKI
ncbi:MAG: ABC transporter ATP-binding protein [Lachnoclostridium sp.]|nr:ABC transporter ATP-binding protein [Lachnoclostridium sp.]